jgi:hypothetical protein
MTDAPCVYNRELLHEVNDKVRGFLAEALPRPGKSTGIVLTDLDLVHRTYGTDFGTDGTGRLLLLEFKRGFGAPTGGQKKTYRLLDQMLTSGGNADRYGGFWLVNYEMDIDDSPFFKFAERMFLKSWQGHCRIYGHDAVMGFLRTGVGPQPLITCPW